jgi:hypothetical protein
MPSGLGNGARVGRALGLRYRQQGRGSGAYRNHDNKPDTHAGRRGPVVCREPRGPALDTKAAEQGGPIGLFMAFLFLIGGAFALAFPFVSVLAFFFAGIIGLAGGASTSFGDLTVWGVVSLILAVLSYFGWREKRKRRREEAARVV